MNAKRLAACAFLILALGFVTAQSQPPAPSPATKRAQPKQTTAQAQKVTTANERGTEQSPIFVKVVPSTKTQEEAPKGKTQEFGQSSPDWWMVWLTGAIVFIGLVQTIVFGIQAYRLKQTIEKMEELGKGQTADMQKSIGEATRAATAMEQVATSMGVSSSAVRDGVVISREIADRQKLISELQSRAYLSVEHLGIVPQNAATGMRFEPRAIIVNRGNTPAYKVKFSVCADVVPFPLADDYPFELPEIPTGEAGSIIASTLNKIVSAVVPKTYSDSEAARIKAGIEARLVMWGHVTYEDAFGIARFVKFGFSYLYFEDGINNMSDDIPRHNESN